MPNPESAENHLKLLLSAYSEARDDDRYYFTQFTALVTIALSLIVGMAAVYTQTCAAGSLQCQETTLIPVPVWVYIGGPILPTALLAFSVTLATANTLRSYYLRTLEVKIHHLTNQQNEKLPIPSWSHLTLTATGQSRASFWPKLNFYLMYGIIAAIVLSWAAVVFFKIPDVRLRIFAAVFDLLILAVPAKLATMDVTEGALLWEAATNGLPGRLARTRNDFKVDQSRETKRTLVSYLLLPRNQEELLKALFLPGCFLIGTVLAPEPIVTSWSTFWSHSVHVIGFYIVFEFIFYQGRYLLNDIRDRKVDADGALSKSRFPRPPDDEIALQTAARSFALRCALGLLVVFCVLPVHHLLLVDHLLLIGLIFLTAALYEWLRTRCNSAASQLSLTGWTIALILVVGLGYGLRSFVGLWLSGLGGAPLLSVATLGAVLFGCAFVSLTWAFESTRPGVTSTAKKRHLLVFRRWVSRHGHSVGPDKRVLQGFQSIATPWTATTILSTVILGLFIMMDVDATTGQNGPFALLSESYTYWAILGLGLASLLQTTLPMPFAWAGVAANFLVALLLQAMIGVSPTRNIVGTALVILPTLTACAFRGMSYEDFNYIWARVWIQLQHVWRAYCDWFKKIR